VISSSDVTPGWTVLDEFRAMLKEGDIEAVTCHYIIPLPGHPTLL
jgi:hypothetical protein